MDAKDRLAAKPGINCRAHIHARCEPKRSKKAMPLNVTPCGTLSSSRMPEGAIGRGQAQRSDGN